jgi:hypothetical protein
MNYSLRFEQLMSKESNPAFSGRAKIVLKTEKSER